MTAFSNRGQFPAMFGPTQLAQLELIVTKWGQFPESIRNALFRMEKADRDIWRSLEVLDLPLAQPIPEGSQYPVSRPVQGLAKTFTPAKQGGMVSLTKEMVEDGQIAVMATWARKLGEAILQKREIDAANIFNNAFSSTLAQDGLSLINSGHLVGELTYDNTLSGNPDLSEASLQQALGRFERAFIRSNGTYIDLRPRLLVVAPENKRYARELVESEYKPDNNFNNINSARADNLMVVSSPYLTDPDAWFLQAQPSDTGLIICERQGIATASSGFDEGPGFTTDSALIKASYREDIGVTNAYGIIGSSGS